MTFQYRAWQAVVGVSAFLVGSVALAQPGAAPSGAPSAPPQGQSVPQQPAAPPTLAQPVAPITNTVAPAAPGSCRLGEHEGTLDTDARTAASIVCRELPPEAKMANRAYRVDIEKLGSAMFLVLNAESDGVTVDSRRVKLNAIEDVPTAAPHLVDALIHQKTMKETEKVDNLTSSDSPAPMHKNGQFQVGVGILGAVAPGVAAVAPGGQLTLRYDTPRWVLTTQFRFAVDTGGDRGFAMTSLGVGPRYFLSLEDTAFFVGGGMAIEGLWQTWPTATTKGNSDSGYSYGTTHRPSAKGSGIAAYAEFGVEMMRLHKNRLNAGLRADFPTFGVGGDYLVPISLTTSFVFN